MDSILFRTLSRDVLEKDLSRLMAISCDVSPWREENFLVDLPGKWDLSFLAASPDPIGYAILSAPEVGRVHVHQFMLAPAWRGRGAGRAMLDEAKARCRARGSALTLKVAKNNVSAVRFYEREELIVAGEENGYLKMAWQVTGDRL